jgi:hypothetical protein
LGITILALLGEGEDSMLPLLLLPLRLLLLMKPLLLDEAADVQA